MRTLGPSDSHGRHARTHRAQRVGQAQRPISWCLGLDLGKDENGRRQRIFKSGFERKADADTELARLLQGFNEGTVFKVSPRKFQDHISEWFREYAENQCTPKTVERYRQLANYVLPHIGQIELGKLSALTLERLYNRLKLSGGKRRTKSGIAPLAPKTVRHIASVVHAALDSAVRWKLIPVNPADACQLPKLANREAKALDPSQTQWYLDAARGQWLFPILVTAAATGARRGELLALRWVDLDLANRSMHISRSLEQTKAGLRIKPPKGDRSRSLSLPAVAVEVLQTHRAAQAIYRASFASDYRADLDLVFANPDGNYLKPDSVTAAACTLARRAGLAGVSLHSLRHSHGSQLLSAGVPLPTVSKRLGHSSVHITGTIYSHAFSLDEIAAGEAWDRTMRPVIENPAPKH